MATNQTPPTLVPNRIEAAMVQESRTQKWTAERAGIAETTFRRKLRKPDAFSVGELAQIAHVLRVSPASLLPDEFQEAAA